MPKVKEIKAREILSSGAYPTIEVSILLKNGTRQKASVPFGSSYGSHEAKVLIDGKKRYLGYGCMQAVQNVNKKIAPKLLDVEVSKQEGIDELLLSLDGTDNKRRLGGNAILAVSLAMARASAVTQGMTLYRYIRKTYSLPLTKFILPKPMMVVIEGGKHAANSTDMQEYMIVPFRYNKARDAVRAGAEIYLTLGANLKKAGLSTQVGNEGAYAPEDITDNEEPLKRIMQAIKMAGYKPGKDVFLALDPASTEFYTGRKYYLTRENKRLTATEMIDIYQRWLHHYPIMSIEDGLSEDDWRGWVEMTKRLGKAIKVIGDDLTVTNKERLERAVKQKAINAIVIKPNQIGTLTETIETIRLAQKNNYWTVVSHRGGGETNDSFIIDLAVATNSQFVKVGICRGERVEKYNRLMEIEEELGI